MTQKYKSGADVDVEKLAENLRSLADDIDEQNILLQGVTDSDIVEDGDVVIRELTMRFYINEKMSGLGNLIEYKE